MSSPVHIAITRRVLKEHVGEFEAALAEFAKNSLDEPGMRGVHCLYPPPCSDSREYGILRTFASAKDRDAFYASPIYREWLVKIAPWVEGEPMLRDLQGFELWFKEPHLPMPPKWKMAVLTWLAVWPVSVAVPVVLKQMIPGINGMPFVFSGIAAAGVVIVLTWGVMPLFVKIVHKWLHPEAN